MLNDAAADPAQPAQGEGERRATATDVADDLGPGPRQRRWRWLGAVATLGLASMMLAAVGRQGTDASASRPQRATPAFDVERLDRPGQRLRLDEYRGTPVLVNFWASWCVPCRQEMPELQAVRDRYGDRLVVVGINMWDSATDANALLAELGVTYPQGTDGGSTVVKDFGIDSVPSTAFITADGRYAAVANGKPSPAELQEMITKHLGLASAQGPNAK